MTDTQLAALSTICWIVGTTTLFVLLAHWSAGGSWGIATAIVRGVGGWTGRARVAARPASDLPPMATPQLDRLWGSLEGADAPGTATSSPPRALPTAELEDLGSRRIR